MDPTAKDAQLRQAAFEHVNRLATFKSGVLSSDDLSAGFQFQGERIPLINPQRGIFKPRQIAALLSIRTVFPRRGGRVWNDDQREAHRQIYENDDVVEYAFMGTDPNSADNRWLLDAMQRQVPIIFFLGTSPVRYQPITPTFVVGWHPERLRGRPGLQGDRRSFCSSHAPSLPGAPLCPARDQRRFAMPS
jgi:putative restriction endonuclease